MISIASTLILTRVDPRRLDFLGEYLDEKCKEYLGFRRELVRRKATRVSRSVCRKVERSESVMMRKDGCWKRCRSSSCACETSNEEGKDTRTAHMIICGHTLDELEMRTCCR